MQPCVGGARCPRRLSTIQGADRVVVLEHGAIREQGTPTELMGLPGGLFRQMVQQAARSKDGSLDGGATLWEEDLVAA